MQSDPSGISNDRAEVRSLDDGQAVLAVGPSQTPVYLPEDDLPAGAEPGTWVILDLQLQPPMVLGIDEELTHSKRT